MQKLFMIQTALNNLVSSEEAETVGMDWHIPLVSDNIILVACSDEGFTYAIYDAEQDTWSESYTLDSVSELKQLIEDY